MRNEFLVGKKINQRLVFSTEQRYNNYSFKERNRLLKQKFNGQR